MIKVSRAAATAVAVLALGAGSATSAAASASASASAATVRTTVSSDNTVPSDHSHTQRCTPSQLVVWVDAASAKGTAGTTYYHLDFTNASREKCYLYGWPRAAATNWSGRQLGVPAVRTADVRARVVNLRPGGTAHAVLGYVEAQIGLACVPTVATYLKVSPPGSKGSKNVVFPMAVCAATTWDLTIGRMQAGA